MELLKRTTIREWSEDDRPREKMMNWGPHSLSDAELLAIMISSGTRDESALELSKRILVQCSNNFNELALLSVKELCSKFKGIGPAKAVAIKASLEIGKRRNLKDRIQKTKISSSNDLYLLFEPKLVDLSVEEFWMIVLNGANLVVEMKKMTQGGRQQTVVDVALILKFALEKSAVSLAVAHNHPSGQVKPSVEDDKVTKKLKEGCEAIGLRFLDHIIVGAGVYYSYTDEGKI